MSKNYKILVNYIIGPGLFIWLAFSIYHQIQTQKNLPETWNNIRSQFGVKQWLYSGCLLVLMFINWGIEAVKWKMLMKNVQQLSFWAALKSLFSGQAFSLTTITNLGEYVGKVAFLEQGNRLKAMAINIIGGLSLIIVTLAGGMIALFIAHTIFKNNEAGKELFDPYVYNWLIWSMLAFLIFFFWYYFNLKMVTAFVVKIKWFKRFDYLTNHINEFTKTDLTKFLLFSFFRFVVFIVQYLLAFELFKVEAPLISLTVVTSLLLYCFAFVPSVAFAELGIRGEISLKLMALVSTNKAGTVFAITVIWFVNRILPAFLGSLFVLRVKLFKKNI